MGEHCDKRECIIKASRVITAASKKVCGLLVRVLSACYRPSIFSLDMKGR